MKMEKKLGSFTLFTIGIISILLLVFVSIVSVTVGAAGYSVEKVIDIILGNGSPTESHIIFNLRIPRIICDIIVGAALALAGVMLQAIFRNPLVEPYILGLASGAGFGAVLSVFFANWFFISFFIFEVSSLIIWAFLGGLLAVFISYYVSKVRHTTPIITLVLAGVIVSALFSAGIMILILLLHPEQAHGILGWLYGTFSRSSWNEVKMSLLFLVIPMIIAFFFYRDMNAMLLGEDEAKHLGIDTERLKKILIVLSTLLTAISVAVAGIIGFVGLIVPHFVRILFGPNHKTLIPFSIIFGAIFIVICDTVARTIAMPLELPVGAITAIIGAPLFLHLLRKKKYEYFG